MNKIEKVLELMKQDSYDGVIFAQGASFQYLLETHDLYWQRSCMSNLHGLFAASNYPSHLLYINKDGDCHIFTPVKDAKYFEKFENVHVIFMEEICDELGQVLTSTNIAAGHDCYAKIEEMVKKLNPEAKCTMEADLVLGMRVIKSKEEIEILKENAKFTDDAFKYVVSNFKHGMRQYDVERLFMEYGMQHDLCDFSFPPTAGFVTKGTENSKTIFAFDQNAPLVENTAIAFDIGYIRKGYCSDWGRTLYYGKAPKHLVEAYHALQQGQINMVNNIIPNKTKASDLYGFILDKVTELGYDEYLRFKDLGSTGHQIGIEVHESLLFDYSIDTVLRPGMVFCSEPKMWFEGEAYFRVEDMILIEEDKAVFLSNFDREFFEFTLDK